RDGAQVRPAPAGLRGDRVDVEAVLLGRDGALLRLPDLPAVAAVQDERRLADDPAVAPARREVDREERYLRPALVRLPALPRVARVVDRAEVPAHPRLPPPHR